MSAIPGTLRSALLERGHSTLEIGDLAIDMGSGEKRRHIMVDGDDLGEAVFTGAEVDWRVVGNHLGFEAAE